MNSVTEYGEIEEKQKHIGRENSIATKTGKL